MLSWISLHWKASALVACVIGIAAASTRLLGTDRARGRRAEQRRKQELRRLADRIAAYGRSVHHRYPTGDVVVRERDLAEGFRKPSDTVVTALNILLGEQKVQRAPMSGYWKLTM